MEINGANYFGVFAHNWEKFGFGALRGVPLGGCVDAVANGGPYWTHPPGFAWLTASIGSAEWQLRLPTVLGHALAAVLVFLLLRPRLGRVAGLVGGLATLGVPMLAFYSLTSYENAVLPLGLLAWWGLRRRGLIVLACLVGPWMDWAFGFFCIAMLPLVIAGNVRDTLRALLLPACVSLLSLLAVFGWMAWASGATGLPSTDFGELLRGLLHRSDTAAAGNGARLFENLRLGFSLPVLLTAAAGLPMLFLAAPRLASAMLIGGVLNAVVFPANTAGHVFYQAYLTPLVAGGLGALPAWAGTLRPLRLLLTVVALAATVLGGVRTIEHFRAADTSFFAEQGALVSAATKDAGGRDCFVFTNYSYGYYLRSPLVVFGVPSVTDPHKLEQLRSRPGYEAYGLRYLLTDIDGPPIGGTPLPKLDPALRAYLERFPRSPQPVLERVVTVPGYDVDITFRCWMVTLRE